MKNILALLLLLTFSSNAFAIGKIDNAGVKSLAECIAAGGTMSCLINDTKIYLSGLSKQLSTAIADGSIGGVHAQGQSNIAGQAVLVPGSGISFVQAGQNITVNSSATSAYSEVTLMNGNGAGSTYTNIRRWSTLMVNIGSDITYTDSATLGASFTLNSTGIYSIMWNRRTNSGQDIGITLNQVGDFTVALNSYSDNTVVICSTAVAAGATGSDCGITRKFTAGDVIRFTDVGTDDVTNWHNRVTISRVN